MICSKCQVDQEPIQFRSRHRQCRKCQAAYTRAYAKRFPEKVKAARAKWGRTSNGHLHALRQQARMKKKYPEKFKARYTLNNAVRDGKIERKPCEVCGSADSHGHHEDYSKPLEVRWLCREHHNDLHYV